MSRNAIVFGTSLFAEVAAYFLDTDSDYRVVGFTCSADQRPSDEFLDRPLVDFESVTARFSPSDHDIFVAVGYTKMNTIRERFLKEAMELGYRPLRYINSHATVADRSEIGDHVFIFEDNTVQPFVTIADDVVLWSGNHIGHHASIGPHTFISSHVVVSGSVNVGGNCFIGVNASIRDGLSIGDYSLIGMGAVINKDTKPHSVHVAPRTVKLDRPSEQLM
jgi:sugar O-acyltransferase (sialic acid O-acetyltransferase NeuD family)